MYTKAQLNAIGYYYSRKNREAREQRIAEFKTSNPQEYELFTKFKYKALDGYLNFMKKEPNFENRKNIVYSYFEKQEEKKAKQKIREQEEKKAQLQKAYEKVKNFGIKFSEMELFLFKYRESESLLNFRKQNKLTFAQLRDFLLN